MSEFVTQAKQARETLARALGALQSDPSVPPALMAVAEPVAQAMGALHAIERTGALGTAGEARDHVRQALGLLQAQIALNHPAVTNAMESVASSLGVIFGLVRASEAAAPQAAAPQAVAPQAVAPQAVAPQAGYAPPPQAAPPAPPAQAYAPQAAPPAAGYAPPPQAAPAAPPPQAAPPAPPPQAAAPQAAPQAAPAAPQAAPAAAPQAAAKAAPAPAGNSARFEVALGISSAANFYKGLAGNDVVEHGGLFVATYNKVPPVGSPVALRVILPGGFEFESMAKVAWVRDSSSGESPGFGARFTQISPEARQLVYRYVRNREPLFYDDL